MGQCVQMKCVNAAGEPVWCTDEASVGPKEEQPDQPVDRHFGGGMPSGPTDDPLEPCELHSVGCPNAEGENDMDEEGE